MVPARGNSQRIARKNLLLGSKPLIAWPVDAVKNIPQVCDILVSTDDPEIAAVARSAGALVPWLRPAKLATDTVLVVEVEVALHTLDWYEAAHGTLDGQLKLQPTNPFTRNTTICRGISLFAANNSQSVLCVSPAASHPLWCFKKDSNHLSPCLVEYGLQMRSQDLPPAYTISGCFYLSAPQVIRASHGLYGAKVLPLIIESPKETIDIDTPWDWQIAQWALSQDY